MHTAHSKHKYIALRTVPVVLNNGNRQIRVNALLDDGSTKTYVNSDVVAELGITGQKELVTVSVLNGKNETFETMPVRIGLRSVNGQVNITMDANTTTNVTGNLKAIDWNKHSSKWHHLQGIDFPCIESTPKVDILIGLTTQTCIIRCMKYKGSQGNPLQD